MKGYYKNPDATAAAIDREGWLHTGDLAVQDEDGYYKVTGRIKDTIIRGGENLFPKEIEDQIYRHPAIRDVSVVGVPSRKYGEEVCAFVILKDNMDDEESETGHRCIGAPIYDYRGDIIASISASGPTALLTRERIPQVVEYLRDAAAQLSRDMYYYITGTTFIILILAANTAYAGFPMLIAVMSKERFAPKQLSHRGDKLSFDNGIIVLSAVSILLIAAFRANVSHLIGLYAVGVFISFTLSQSGMFVRWRRTRERNWKWKAAINGFGAVITGIVVLIIAVAKFTEGSWIVVVLIPMLVFLINKVYIHYMATQAQLKINEDEFAKFDFSKKSYINRIIVPIEHVNRSSVRALRYANMICDNVTAFHVAMVTIAYFRSLFFIA